MTDDDRIVRFRLAAAILALAGTASLYALGTTGHDRVVTVIALATLLLAVLDATAAGLADD